MTYNIMVDIVTVAKSFSSSSKVLTFVVLRIKPSISYMIGKSSSAKSSPKTEILDNNLCSARWP